jgi:hypothetical protein
VTKIAGQKKVKSLQKRTTCRLYGKAPNEYNSYSGWTAVVTYGTLLYQLVTLPPKTVPLVTFYEDDIFTFHSALLPIHSNMVRQIDLGLTPYTVPVRPVHGELPPHPGGDVQAGNQQQDV